MKLGVRWTVAASLWVFFARAAAAGCPDCYEGRVARARAFGSSFAENLAAVGAPFVVTALVSLWSGRSRRRGSREVEERASP